MSQPTPAQQNIIYTTHTQTHEPEPLLSLITSHYPLAASVINSSISVYKSAQSITPGGEWTERHIGLPLARTTARISGVESVARWALQPKQPVKTDQPQASDIEKGYPNLTSEAVIQHTALIPTAEPLPQYDAGDRSPPYSERQALLNRDQQPPQGWQTRLVITTSGLGVAMNERSIQNLKFCLTWLKWANGQLGDAIQKLSDILLQWDRRISQGSQPMSVASITSTEPDKSTLTARVNALQTEVVDTLKKVVSVVSEYAGGALPRNARDLVHHYLVSLPTRFAWASSRRTSNGEQEDETTTNANKALLLAQEGLEMMNQVSRVVNDTLVSAEEWCEKLGRRKRANEQQSAYPVLEKPDFRDRSETVGRDFDTKMEM